MKLKKILLSLFLMGSLMCSDLFAQDRSKLFVDVNYTGDSITGAEAYPFKTIADALIYRQNVLGLAGMVSDEEIIVKPGVYAPDSTQMIILTQSNGGKSGFWLTLKAEGEVFIDGANLYNKKFAALITVTSGAKNVRIQGFKLRNHRCNQSLANTQIIDGVSTIVKDTKFGIQVANTGENIEILNNEIYDFSWTVNVDPMENRLGFTVSEINILKSAAPNDNIGPISVVGTDSFPLKNVVIKNNLIHHVIPGWTEGIQMNGNLDGFEVSRNTIYEVQNIGIVAAGHYGWVPNIEGATVTASQNFARNGIIRNNTVSSCRSPIAAAAGIYCDGSKNVIVENNQVSDCQVGFSIGNENSNVSSGGHIVRNNLSYDNVWTGLVLGVPAAASGSYIDSVAISGNTLFRNGGVADTYLGNLGDSELTIQKNIKNLNIFNNIIYSTGTERLITFSLAFDTDKTSYLNTIAFDYNLYFTNSAETPPLGFFDWSVLGAGYDSYGTFDWYRVNRTDQDVNSSFIDPQFVDILAAVPDFRLQSTSPAINAGDAGYSVSTDETDFFGNERVAGGRVDIGAFESGALASGDVAANIDGIQSIEENYVALQTGVTQGVWKSIYAYDDNHFVYVYGEYTGSMEEYSIFVNVNSTTGHDYIWTEKSDFYVDGTLNMMNAYAESANSTWPFEADSTIMTARFIKTDSTIEGRIPKYALGVADVGTIGLGIEGYSANWSSSVGAIPLESSSMVYLTLDGGSSAGSLSVDGIKSPVEKYLALTTGVTESSFKNIYGYADNEYIYLYAEIGASNLWEYNIYFNKNSATGFQYLWNDKSDYFIDANYNVLNEYDALSTSQWPFKMAVSSTGVEFIMTPTAIEGKIPKSLLGVANSGTIGIGLEGHTADWVNSLGGVPVSGNMVYLSLENGESSIFQSDVQLFSSRLKDVDQALGFNVFPNPVSGPLTINFPKQQAGSFTSIEVVGMDGKVHYKAESKGGAENVSHSIDAHILPKGIVLLRVITGSRVYQSKVLIQ